MTWKISTFSFHLVPLEAPNLGIRGVGMYAGALGGGLEEAGYVRGVSTA